MSCPTGEPPPAVRHVALEAVGSTNDEAFRLARAGASGITLVTAVSQGSGRGRMGRAWASPPGNFYGSFLVTPARPGARLSDIAFVAALAAAETCRAVLPADRRIEIKWPNDILVEGAKVCGILTETEAAPDGLRHVVSGIGINVATEPAAAPYAVTALARHAAVTVAAVRELLSQRFACWYGIWLADGFAPVRAAWTAVAIGAGRPIQVRLGTEVLEGGFGGIDIDGALLLDAAAGRRRIVAGDVMLRTR